MAELLKSKDDCVPDAVDWEEVKLSAFPATWKEYCLGAPEVP